MCIKMVLKTSLLSLLLACLANCSIFNPDPLSHDQGSLYYTSSKNTNLWLLLGRDLNMKHDVNRPEVQQHIKWYMNHKGYLQDIAKHATLYVYYVLQEVKKRHIPSEIALIPVIESNYDPFAYSDDGAAGLWQMMPGTASGYNLKQNWWYDGRRDIYASTQAALNYLQYLHKFFHGDWLLAIAAYNSGEGTVNNAVNYNKRLHKPTDFWDLKLPKQTENYVPKLLAVATIIANPEQYPVKWPIAHLSPYLTAVSVGSQIDLSVAAKLADISIQELYELNPGYSRWATDPDGKHMLLLPANKAELFTENLAKLPKSKRVTWKRYVVKSGDSLIKISHTYETSPHLIMQVNDLKSNVIHIGQVLLIPRARKSFAKSVMDAVKHYLHHERKLPGPNRVVHIVQPDDTLWLIAKDYKVKAREIRFWNQLKRGQALQPGAELILWSQNNTRSYRASRIRPYLIKHTVISGDNLRDLSKEYHVSVAQLKKTNNLKSDTVRLGQILIIPPTVQKLKYGSRVRPKTYKVKSGDSLNIVARRFDIGMSALQHYNNMKNDIIRIGQVLKIPSVKG